MAFDPNNDADVGYRRYNALASMTVPGPQMQPLRRRVLGQRPPYGFPSYNPGPLPPNYYPRPGYGYGRPPSDFPHAMPVVGNPYAKPPVMLQPQGYADGQNALATLTTSRRRIPVVRG